MIDSTAHALKFAGFQDLYFENRFPEDFEVRPDSDLINTPVYIHPKELARVPAPGKPLDGPDFDLFVEKVTRAIAADLKLASKEEN